MCAVACAVACILCGRIDVIMDAARVVTPLAHAAPRGVALRPGAERRDRARDVVGDDAPRGGASCRATCGERVRCLSALGCTCVCVFACLRVWVFLCCVCTQVCLRVCVCVVCVGVLA